MGITNDANERLLQVLAEQLKTPLLQIALQAELNTNEPLETADIARSALRLIDGYVLATDTGQQTNLPLQPVSLSATLQDTAQRLQVHARQYSCQLEVRLAGRYGPVMAHQTGLENALTILGQSFIEAQTNPGQRIILGAHRTKQGLVAGVFTSGEAITTDMFRRAKALTGSARQPLTTGQVGNGAGVFIANSILERMASPLQVARHNALNGLASCFVPSQQLTLVTV